MFESPTRTPYQFSPTLTPPRRRRWWILAVIVVILIFVPFSVWYALQPPANFPAGSMLEIPAGSNASTIATQLADNGYVRSRLVCLGVATVSGEVGSLKAGRYQFSEPYQVTDLLERLATGDYFNSLARLTHVEGQRVEQLAARAAETLVDFSAAAFVEAAEVHEGQLFPETYYVPEIYTEAKLLALLRSEYEERIKPLRIDIARSPLTEEEIIILASILEREANDPESKRMVSGILHNRLAIDMPLQADATIEYVLNKPLSELAPEDLELDSPYNTYLNNGLPPTPIGNPGMTAIEAAVNPAETEYFYYITGTDGQFYYAEDFDQHRENIARHLRR